MSPHSPPVPFLRHAGAVLVAASIGSLGFTTLIFICGIVADANQLGGESAREAISGALAVAIAYGVLVFATTLVTLGPTLTVLWPVTRRGSSTSRTICLLASATLGIVLAVWYGTALHTNRHVASTVLLAVAMGVLYWMRISRVAASSPGSAGNLTEIFG